MSIFKRLRTILKAGFDDLLEEEEEPGLILERVISEMKGELRETKLRVASAIRDQIRLEKQLKEQMKLVERWDCRARRAVMDGNDDLARRALSERIRCERLVEELKNQLQMQKEAVKRLKAGLTRLEERVEEAECRKVLLLARMKRAKAARTVAQTLSGISSTDVTDLLEQIEREVLQTEAEAEVVEEMKGSSLEEAFRRLRQEDVVEGELERLKSEIGRMK
jgi:phage shock protein A